MKPILGFALQKPRLARHPALRDHADRDRGPVRQPVVGGVLEAVADGVAEVEDLAQPAFPLVGGHHGGLDPDRGRDEPGQRGGLAVSKRADAPLDVGEELTVAGGRHLESFGDSIQELRLGQGPEEPGIGEDGSRLAKDSNQVLPVRGVDPGLASHGGVHRREQRGRDRNERHPAEIGRGHEPREVGDHAAAEPDDHRVAAQAAGKEFVLEARLFRARFRVLARRNLEDEGSLRQHG